PFKSGFSFSGWFKDSDKTIAYTFNEAVTANITLYAKWAVHTEGPYLITFDSKGGSSVPSQTVAFGGKAAKPLNPTRTGFNFVGWYEDEDCTILYNFDEPVTKNMLLYAKWDINEYTVTFVSKGGSDVVEKTVEHGSKVEEPDEPTLKGHRFAGWYTDEDYEDEYEFSTLVTGSFTLYAKWNIIPFSAYFNAPAKIYVREGNKVDYVVSVSNIGGDGSNLFIIEADFDSEYLNFEGYNFSLEINAYSPAQREFSFDDNGKLSLTMFFTRSMVLLKADEETSLAIFHFSLKDSAIPVKAVIESFLSKVTAYIFYDVLPTPVDAVIMKPGAPVAVLISPLDLEEEELDKTTIEWLILHHLYKTGAADDWDDIKKYDLNGNNMIDLADIVALWSLIDK
ncbi:MAG: InlB B-repeat-containing protein, partial [Clostridiales bacterium]|nr:InlB B-repeat-containing protein [Clostridiales bacterium]